MLQERHLTYSTTEKAFAALIFNQKQSNLNRKLKALMTQIFEIPEETTGEIKKIQETTVETPRRPLHQQRSAETTKIMQLLQKTAETPFALPIRVDYLLNTLDDPITTLIQVFVNVVNSNKIGSRPRFPYALWRDYSGCYNASIL